VEEFMKPALARLRAKTDQDLSILLARQLQRSLAHRTSYEDAMRVYETARGLLAVAELPPAQRERLENLLTQLHARVERPASAVA
jgi:hypothetical protein